MDLRPVAHDISQVASSGVSRCSVNHFELQICKRRSTSLLFTSLVFSQSCPLPLQIRQAAADKLQGKDPLPALMEPIPHSAYEVPAWTTSDAVQPR